MAEREGTREVALDGRIAMVTRVRTRVTILTPHGSWPATTTVRSLASSSTRRDEERGQQAREIKFSRSMRVDISIRVGPQSSSDRPGLPLGGWARLVENIRQR